jgi:hypothetical protein
MINGLAISVLVTASAITFLAHLCLPGFLLPERALTAFIAVSAAIGISYVLIGLPLHLLLKRLGLCRLRHYAVSGAGVAGMCGAALEIVLAPERSAAGWLGLAPVVAMYSLVGAFCAATF